MMGTKDSSTVVDISKDIIVNVEEIDVTPPHIFYNFS